MTDKKKHIEAIKTVKIARIYLLSKDAQNVYNQLNDNYFHWNEKRGVWEFAPTFSWERA